MMEDIFYIFLVCFLYTHNFLVICGTTIEFFSNVYEIVLLRARPPLLTYIEENQTIGTCRGPNHNPMEVMRLEFSLIQYLIIGVKFRSRGPIR